MIDRFATPWVLAALALLPVLAWRAARRPVRAVLFSDTGSLQRLSTTWRVRCRWVPSALRVTALGALIVAAARPQRVAGKLPTPAEGIAIQIVMDRSGSMAEPFDAGSDGA